jgi:hypothetical protein
VVIPVCVSAACALAFIYAKYRLIALSLLACCMVLMFSDIYPILSYRRTFNGEKQFALFVKEKTPENAIIIAMDDSVFIEYYGLRKCITYPPDQAGLDRFILTISGYLRNNVPVYFSTGCLYGYDRKNILRRALRENFNLKLTGAHLAEDYHRAEVSFQTYSERLYKVELKK